MFNLKEALFLLVLQLNSDVYSELLKGKLNEMERVTGIEPASAAWEAAVLPLNYTRTIIWCPQINNPYSISTNMYRQSLFILYITLVF